MIMQTKGREGGPCLMPAPTPGAPGALCTCELGLATLALFLCFLFRERGGCGWRVDHQVPETARSRSVLGSPCRS